MYREGMAKGYGWDGGKKKKRKDAQFTHTPKLSSVGSKTCTHPHASGTDYLSIE